jgi:hypothetical protein
MVLSSGEKEGNSHLMPIMAVTVSEMGSGLGGSVAPAGIRDVTRAKATASTTGDNSFRGIFTSLGLLQKSSAK